MRHLKETTINKNTNPKVSKAYYFAKAMHAGQVDKAGYDYFISHVLGVVDELEDSADETTYIAALLHDVVEDTEVKLSDVLRFFGGPVGATVATLTRSKGPDYYDYADYIDTIKRSASKEAVAVKIADLTHNLSTPWAIPASLVNRYKKALVKLKGE